jgi:pyruvate kinase
MPEIYLKNELFISAVSAVHAAYHIGAAAIITVTTSGKTAAFVSKYRPQCPTVAVTR